jgi:hypothetical protein
VDPGGLEAALEARGRIVGGMGAVRILGTVDPPDAFRLREIASAALAALASDLDARLEVVDTDPHGLDLRRRRVNVKDHVKGLRAHPTRLLVADGR